jgi:hypothetical protein
MDFNGGENEGLLLLISVELISPPSSVRSLKNWRLYYVKKFTNGFLSER